MEKDQVEELVILHFNDAYNIQPNDQGLSGFVNFYDYVFRMREKYKNSLLVFSGDAFAPSKLSRVLKGEQMVHCIKMLGIDVACYGNHDFDFDPAHCMKLAKSCQFPWLMSNIKYIDTNRNIGDGLEYYIIERCGIKIGFLGLAGPDFNGRLISNYKGRLKYIAIADHAKKVCNTLIEQNCQLIIALTHCRRPADEELAAKVPQIDLILGGHDHHSLMKVINKIPIVKSGSDFQTMSIVKINLARQNDKSTQSIVPGRKWTFDITCKQVKKAQKQYPQLTKYIENAVLSYRQYQNNKSVANNKPKAEKIAQYPDEWLLSYHFMNNRPAVSLKAGLSAEVCFAKYVAFKKNMFYGGYQRKAPLITDNFVEENLEFVYKEVKSHMNQGKTILYSPGICSVPYLVETGNIIYLPSHFLVGINSFKALETVLNIAHDKGYRCYAVVGYDPFIKDQLCAWIKFTHPPIQYLKLIEQLQIENVLFMSVHSVKSEDHGSERNARLLSGADMQTERKMPLSRDIYLLYVKEGYGQFIEKDIGVFKKLVKQLSDEEWMHLSKKPLASYIHDWESGIDCIDCLESRFRTQLSSQKIQFYYILHSDSFKLYMLAYYLGKVFITYNFDEEKHPVVAQGIVFNQYFMNNPTYELNYGYIPILYWQFYPKNEERLRNVLTQQELKLKRWFNMHKGTNAPLLQKESVKISTTHEGHELLKWITKYAPKQYFLKYLSTEQIIKTLGTYKLVYVNLNIQHQHAKFQRISEI